jgi:hypothetical protein
MCKSLYLATVRSHCPSGLKGSFIRLLIYAIFIEEEEFLKNYGKKRKDEIKNCTFRISDGPVTGCTVPFEIRKVRPVRNLGR